MKEKISVLVTGGAGYIGAHVVNLLRKSGEYKIDVVDIFLESKKNIISDTSVTYHEVDIRNKDSLLKVFQSSKPEIVFHLAALTSVPGSVAEPASYYSVNIFGGINLLECMIDTKVNKIVFSSSAAVYGNSVSEFIDESHIKLPTNPYGYTKLVFENILKDYNKAYGFTSISLRYFCAAGCDTLSGLGEHHKNETHVIPSIIETILGKRDEFFVYGNKYATSDGTGIRDYIHVSDLAEGHICAMNKLLTGENICNQYNLGIGKGFSVLELIKEAEAISGKKLNFSFREARPGDPSKLVADSTRAQKDLGWKPRFLDIRELVESVYIFKNSTKEEF